VPEPPGPFRLGVNYWPSRDAMDWLSAYDPVRTRADFGIVAAAGLDTVRVFLRWDTVQPAPTTIDVGALGHVVDAADAAATAGVDLVVTLFTGHMSGVNYAPAWATGGSEGDRRFRVVTDGTVQPPATGLRNWFGDPEITDAQARLATAVSSALAGHPAVWAWDLGNENSNCTVPAGAAAGEAWLERMTGALRSADPGRPVTIGIHMEDLEEDRGIGPAEAARWCDLVCMHGYPIYADWSGGPTDDRLVPFLALVTRWLSGDAPVLFEEFGLPTAPIGVGAEGLLVDETAAATYTGAVIDGLRVVGAVGALVWCFSDYAPSRFDRAPLDQAVHERTFGLWRADGSPKPAVAELTSRRGTRRLTPPPVTDGSWLDIDVAAFASDRRGQLARLYRRYRRWTDGAEAAEVDRKH
jgi:endo-1,4-beta-mannosidase